MRALLRALLHLFPHGVVGADPVEVMERSLVRPMKEFGVRSVQSL